MAATRQAAATIRSSQDGLRGIARQLMALDLKASTGGNANPRHFATSSRSLQGEEPQSATSAASSSTAKLDFKAILADTAPPPAPSTSTSPSIDFPTPAARRQHARGGSQHMSVWHPSRGAPYRLHAHCTKHNTILALTRDLPGNQADYNENQDAEGMYDALQSGRGVSDGAVDPKILGQTVLRTSPGLLGLKKAQRGTFEAASRASVQMFNLIAQLGTKDRTNKKGQKVRDDRASSIELVLKGFGPGRDALVAALNSSQGDQVRQKICRIRDATPIKIGGTRPKKRRKLSPPLDLSRRRR